MKSLLMFLVLSGGVSMLQAQDSWVPFTASYSDITIVKDASGNTVRKSTLAGTKVRLGNGDTLVRLLERDGNPYGRGMFWQTATGKAYDLFYDSKRANLTSIGPAPREHRNVIKNAPIGTQVINGLLCTGYAMNNSGPGTGKSTVWVSVENDLEVKIEYAFSFPDGTAKSWTVELSNIVLNQEPPVKDVSIPPGFQVIENLRASTQCAR